MSPDGKIKVVLADDHAIVLDGIRALLQPYPHIVVVACAANGEEAWKIVNSTPVDILITDYSMGEMNGAILVRQVKKVYPSIKIIMLSMHDQPSIIQEVFKAGIDGYVFKKHTHQELINAIESVAKGGQFLTPEINRILMQKLPGEAVTQITDRERDVLKLLVNELNTLHIVNELGISERTVEAHRKNLLRKTNSQNIVELIKFAHTQNIT